LISLAPGTKVYLACRPVDLRNGFDGLAAKAQQMIGADPFLCVERDYVAARSRHGQSRNHDQFCRHIIFNQPPGGARISLTRPRGESVLLEYYFKDRVPPRGVGAVS
jgi:hypothetical protein